MVEKAFVTNVCALRLANGTFVAKGRVKHSLNRNLPDVRTWVAIKKVEGVTSIMAGHCTCAAG